MFDTDSIEESFKFKNIKKLELVYKKYKIGQIKKLLAIKKIDC